MNDFKLTQEQKELFDYIDSIIPKNGHLPYDFNDSKQYEFAQMLSKFNGRDLENYPGHFQFLADIKDHHLKKGPPRSRAKTLNSETSTQDTWQTTFDIPNIGVGVDNNLAAANGVGTVLEGFQQMSLDLYITDDVTNNVLASGSNIGFAPDALIPVETNTAGAMPVINPITAYLSYSYQPRASSSSTNAWLEGAPGDTGVVKRAGPSGPVADPIVMQPKKKDGNKSFPDSIAIGLNRPNIQTDVDYYAVEPNEPTATGRVPFVGNVLFAKNIAPLSFGNNPSLLIYVARQNEGGVTQMINPADLQIVFNGFSIDPNNPKSLQWNLPATADGNLLAPGANPIVFNKIPWNTSMDALFHCGISVLFTDNSRGFTTIQSDPGDDLDPLDGTKYIKPIQFIWHCLGEGTQITLANDKGLKPIEDFVQGDSVSMDNKGSNSKVLATHRGHHSGSVIQITTDHGHSLVLTRGHVVITPSGECRAHELNKGDSVVTNNGVSKINQVKELPDYIDLLHNLSLDKYLEPKNSDGKINTFFANGIQVGDMNAEKILKHKRRNDKEWVKAQVGAFWAKDVDSHFARR